MPAHLARHMNTIHGPKGGLKSAVARAKKKAKKRLGRPKGIRATAAWRPVRSSAIGVPSFSEGSARLLGDMRALHGELLAERASLDGQLTAVANAMQVLGGAAPAKAARRTYKKKKAVRQTYTKKRGRPAGAGVRAGSLKDYIARVLRQTTRPMSPHDLGTSVIKAGFETKAKNITKAVSNTLPQMKGIKKMGFGKYQLSAR